MTYALIAGLVLVAVAALAALRDAHVRSEARVSHLLDQLAAERLSWSRERWELNTRFQSPELMRMSPPPPPTAATATPQAAAVELDEDDVDESHLVGTIAANPAHAD